MKRIVIIGVLLVAIFTFSGLFIVRPYTSGVAQPIAFNHAKHLEKGVECFGCHGAIFPHLPESATLVRLMRFPETFSRLNLTM